MGLPIAILKSCWEYFVKVPTWAWGWGKNVKMKVAQSCPTLWRHRLYSPWNSPGQNTGMGSLFFLQGIFPTQGSNQSLPHYRKILDQLSHRGSPRILEWVAYPFFSGSSQPSNQMKVSCTAGGFFINWDIREAPEVEGVPGLSFNSSL